MTPPPSEITVPKPSDDEVDAATQTVTEGGSVVRLKQRRPKPRGANGRFISYREQQVVELTAGELPDDRFLDREISWLQFNERVLQLAGDESVPLLERARFLAIFASNLDEFFMVRVAGLKRRIATGIAVRSASGLEPREVLDEISHGAHDLMSIHGRYFQQHIRPALEDEGITITRPSEWSTEDREFVEGFFRTSVYPVLTPLAVDPAHPFPYISGLSLNLAVMLRNPKTGREHFARVKVPPLLPRMVVLPDSPDADELYETRFVTLEDVIADNLEALFPGMDVGQHYTFRVTRNEDLEVEEDDAENLLTALEKELTRRRFGPPVRLEVAEDVDAEILGLLVRELGVRTDEVYPLPEPLDLRALNTVADLDRSELRWPPFTARTHPDLAPVERASSSDVFAAMREGDVLLHHPYDSFSTSVVALLEQAAADPDVLAIKQTLYRTSGNSPIIDALIEAAEAGKQVLAVVEIKARFDEENNITWARKLERAGVHVVYGMVGLKTHAKLCLVVRAERGRMQRYCHVGTGNYNPKTARLYEDLGLLTCDDEVGEDLSRLFNQLSGMAPRSKFKRLLVAPRTVRTGLVAQIERCAEAARAGKAARIAIKVNSLVDEQCIDACYRASQAGAHVDVWVRGICALKPGVEDLSENIRVRSVLGRYLEHSRVFLFEVEGSEPVVYIGSADLMHRNLDRRVEALVRLTDPRHVRTLQEIFALGMSDSTSSWHLQDDGSWDRHHQDADGQPLTEVQSELISTYGSRKRKKAHRR